MLSVYLYKPGHLHVQMLHMHPGFSWDRHTFPLRSCCVLDLVQEECWELCVFSCWYEIKDFFHIFSYSANDQVCRNWEGAQPDRQPSWPMEIFNATDIMLSLWTAVGWGAGIILLLCPWVWILSCRAVRTCLGLWSFLGIWWNPWFSDSTVAAQGLAENQSSHCEKIVFYIVCFAYALLSLLLLIVVAIFPLLSY